MSIQYLTKYVFLSLLILSSCVNDKKDKKDSDKALVAGRAVAVSSAGTYDMSKPVNKWELPAQLNEISGIVKIDNNRILAIEDLHPTLYTLNLDNGKASIADTISFYETAKDKFDIEDVAVIGNDAYALWSHGSIFKITDWKKGKQVKEIETGLDKKNNTEGLAYDPVTGNLLIACKNESGLADEKKSARALYELDIKTEKLLEKPFLVIESKDLKAMSGDKVKFFPSGVAVNPATHDIYVISTKDTKCMAQFSHDGQLKSFTYLDKDLLEQPEGISFDPSGNLYISTEGKHGKPGYIYQFGLKQ
jgi:DNA-binding beta-propeller fold protein YncE